MMNPDGVCHGNYRGTILGESFRETTIFIPASNQAWTLTESGILLPAMLIQLFMLQRMSSVML